MRLPEFECDCVARQQSVKECFAFTLRGTTVALGCLVEGLEQLLAALLVGAARDKFVEQYSYGVFSVRLANLEMKTRPGWGGPGLGGGFADREFHMGGAISLSASNNIGMKAW